MSERDDIRALRSLLESSSEAANGRGPGALERAWNDLELPPVDPPPPGFAIRVAARARTERRSWLGWLGLSMTPMLARAAAVLALACGVAGGIGLGWVAEDSVAGSEVTAEALPSWGGSTLAEEFVTSASGSSSAASQGDSGSSGQVRP